MKTISAQEFESLYGDPTQYGFEKKDEKKSFIDSIRERQQARSQELAGRIEAGQGIGSTALQTAGQVVALGGDIIGEGINKVTGGLIPKAIEAGSKLVPDFIANAGADAILGYENWKESNPEAAANLEATANLASLVPAGTLAKGGVRAGQTAGRAATEAVSGVVTAARETAAPVLSSVSGAARGVADAATLAAEGVSRIPARISTNVAEKVATREAIQALPTKVARTAVQDGIDLKDVKNLYSIPEAQKTQVKPLVDAVKKFANGDTTANPIEIIGKPIVDKLKTLEGQRVKIGEQLGEVANNLGVVTKPELSDAVIARLQAVPGLQGLTLKNGKLNFTNTSIASTLSKSDQSAIQEALQNATKWGNDKKAHLYRQELFEILGGKKKSLANITDTQEKGLEAIRQGLSDVLETKNGAYKTLSSQYRAVVQPLSSMRKLLKAEGLDEDLLDLSAALIARRLTSNAPSNPAIRQILRSMDKVVIKGKTLPNTELLQDVYNILDRYYNIEGGTTLQGQFNRALTKSRNAKDFVVDSIVDVAGKTPAVQQKAIEDVLTEIFGK